MNKTWGIAFGFVFMIVAGVVWPMPNMGPTKSNDVVGKKK
jgi:hypothetical protein